MRTSERSGVLFWVVILFLFSLNSCSFLFGRNPAALSRRETRRLAPQLVGQTKAQILAACGEPQEIAQSLSYKGIAYEEFWRYPHACTVKAIVEPSYAIHLWFLDGRVAEVEAIVY